jgi:hypothetical protein
MSDVDVNKVRIKAVYGAPSAAAAMTKLEQDSNPAVRQSIETPKEYYSRDQQDQVANLIAWHKNELSKLNSLVRGM